MPRGICKMCLEEKELQDSHLIPAAVYKIIRSPNATGDASPLSITVRHVRRTAQQLKRYLLCKNCEQLLSTKAENWVIPRLANKKGFVLEKMLDKTLVVVNGHGDRRVLGAHVAGLEIDKLVHFAMGIFWKASVHDWGEVGLKSRVGLGKYGELARKFLLGEITFPAEMKLLMILSPLPLKIKGIKMPMEGRRSGWCRTFNFLIPGLAFMLCVGKVPDDLASVCFVTGRDNPILIKDLSAKVTEWAAIGWREARISKNVQRALKPKGGSYEK